MCGFCLAVLQPSNSSTEVREDVDVNEDIMRLELAATARGKGSATFGGKGATAEVWEEV